MNSSFTMANFQLDEYSYKPNFLNNTKLKLKTCTHVQTTFRKSQFQATVWRHFPAASRPTLHSLFQNGQPNLHKLHKIEVKNLHQYLQVYCKKSVPRYCITSFSRSFPVNFGQGLTFNYMSTPGRQTFKSHQIETMNLYLYLRYLLQKSTQTLLYNVDFASFLSQSFILCFTMVNLQLVECAWQPNFSNHTKLKQKKSLYLRASTSLKLLSNISFPSLPGQSVMPCFIVANF